MNVEEIKRAVREGKTVCHGSDAYIVSLYTFKNGTEQWLIRYAFGNDYFIGLTWADGKTLNGKEEDFYIKE